MKKFVLFDHDGVLVDTEFWYFKAGKRALSEIGFPLEEDEYLRDMNQGLGTWAQAKRAGVEEETINELRAKRNQYYQGFLRTEDIEIDGVVEVLEELSNHVKMAIVTTSKRADFELIHEKRSLTRFIDFVLVREDYEFSKPHPEPYLLGLEHFNATKSETIVVEDSLRGLNSAIAAGIDCVVVHNAFTKASAFPGARFRIEKLAELKNLILSAT